MTTPRRFLLALALLPGLVLPAAAPALGADGGTGDDNRAIAVNAEDGAGVFRLAFSVRRVANGVIDETNSAYALASCTDCQTIALAFQVVLALGDVDVAVPENRAVAVNDECAECLTYASATQIVLGFDRPARFTAEGRQRLAALRQRLRTLEERAASMTLTELNAEVQAAKGELVAILEEELVEAPAPPGDRAAAPEGGDVDPAEGPTTTTSPTTSRSDDSATTTSSTATSSTTSSTSPTSTTTTSKDPVSTTTTAGNRASTTTTATASAGES